MTRIFHWFFMWKMDPMSGLDIRLVFTLPPSDSTLQYKRCVHLWNNFSCIINPCVRSNNFTFRYLRFIPSECRDLGIKKLEFLANLDSIFLFFFYRCCSLIENYPGWIQTEFIYRLSGNIANIQSLRFVF